MGERKMSVSESMRNCPFCGQDAAGSEMVELVPLGGMPINGVLFRWVMECCRCGERCYIYCVSADSIPKRSDRWEYGERYLGDWRAGAHF